MVRRSLLGRVFTLCLVYVPTIKTDIFLDSFIFILLSSENLTSEGDLQLTLHSLVDTSDTRSWEFYSSGPFLTPGIIQADALAEQVLPSLKIHLVYSPNHLLITPIYYISLSSSFQESFQDSVAQTERGQVTWSISLPALTTQRDCLVSLSHKKHEQNNFLFNSFLALEVETSKNQICFQNGTLSSCSLYRIYKVVLKRKLIEKTPGIERGGNVECGSFSSEINNLEVYKNMGAKQMFSKLLFLGCLLHVLVSEKTACILYQCSQKYSQTVRNSHAVTACEVRSQQENHIAVAARRQTGNTHYLLRTRVRVHVTAQHREGESQGTQSSRGPDAETKSYKAAEDEFLPRLTNLICYFLDFRPSADKLKEADDTVLKARKDKSDFSSRRDVAQLQTEFGFVAVLTATLKSVLPKALRTASGKISHFHVSLITRHSDLILFKFGTLFSLKKEKACGQLKWKFWKELLIEDVRNKWTDIVLYKLLEPSRLSRQTGNSDLLLPVLFALFGKQFVQKVRMNKPKPCLNANKLLYETTLSLKEILLAILTASNPWHVRTFQLLKLIISVHKLCEYEIQGKMRSGYKFILR